MSDFEAPDPKCGHLRRRQSQELNGPIRAGGTIGTRGRCINANASMLGRRTTHSLARFTVSKCEAQCVAVNSLSGVGWVILQKEG